MATSSLSPTARLPTDQYRDCGGMGTCSYSINPTLVRLQQFGWDGERNSYGHAAWLFWQLDRNQPRLVHRHRLGEQRVWCRASYGELLVSANANATSQNGTIVIRRKGVQGHAGWFLVLLLDQPDEPVLLIKRRKWQRRVTAGAAAAGPQRATMAGSRSTPDCRTGPELSVTR